MPQSTSKYESSLDQVKVVPLHRNVLVKPKEVPDLEKGGIIIPKTYKDMVIPTSGTVLALGDELLSDPGSYLTPLREGDKIIFSKYAGVKVDFEDGASLIILNYDDILAIVGTNTELIENKSL